jgi:hypothetical protein
VTTYRIGEQGATVYDATGAVVLRLPPGYVVVEGVTFPGPDLPASYGKRVWRYADKALHPAEDKR